MAIRSDRIWRKNGQRYLGASPSKKSIQRLKTKISELLAPGNKGPWPEVRGKLNRLLRGWSNYFSYGTRLAAYRGIDSHVSDRVRSLLVKRHKLKGRGTRQFSNDTVFGELGVLSSERYQHEAPSSTAVKTVGEPDARNPHVRLCVQRRLACSAGERPAGAKIRTP